MAAQVVDGQIEGLIQQLELRVESLEDLKEDRRANYVARKSIVNPKVTNAQEFDNMATSVSTIMDMAQQYVPGLDLEPQLQTFNNYKDRFHAYDKKVE